MQSVPDLVCFDLPCLVVPDPVSAPEALDRSLRRLGVEPEWPHYRGLAARRLGWPGRAARAAFDDVFGSDVWAEAAAAAFDDAYGAAVARYGAVLADGAATAVWRARDAGARICLTTEFSAATREAVLDVLDWPDLVAMLLSEEGVGGVAAVIPAAIDRAACDPTRVVVVSASCGGVAAGREADAGVVVGLLGQGTTSQELQASGATEVCSLAELATRWGMGRLMSA